MRNQNRHPLPTLIALPIPVFKARRGPPGFQNRFADERSKIEVLDVHRSAIICAMDELRAVIELTLSFLKDGPDYVTPSAEWLSQLKSSLDDLEEVLWRGFHDGDATIDKDDVLDCLPEFETDFDESVDPFSSKLLSFWLSEIKRRGHELINIGIMSVDVCEARNIFQTMKTLRYPIR